jgi:large subunit ribosomal protein L7/L12
VAGAAKGHDDIGARNDALEVRDHKGRRRSALFIPISVLIVIGVVFLLLVGWALRSSRTRDPLMGGGRASLQRARPAGGAISGRPATPLPPEAAEQIRVLLAAGRKIEAIKLAREACHIGLKEAKDLVESME